MAPPESIIPEKVGEWELRRRFNDAEFYADLKKRHRQTVETYCEPAPASAGQAPGTMSIVHDWYEYDDGADRTRLLATVHFYRNPDGTIGASGRVDPQLLVIGNAILTDP